MCTKSRRFRRAIDLDSVMKKCVVFAMDGEYAGIAGANSCHLIGEEHFFHSVDKIRACTDFRNPTDLSRFKHQVKYAFLSGL